MVKVLFKEMIIWMLALSASYRLYFNLWNLQSLYLNGGKRKSNWSVWNNKYTSNLTHCLHIILHVEHFLLEIQSYVRLVHETILPCIHIWVWFIAWYIIIIYKNFQSKTILCLIRNWSSFYSNTPYHSNGNWSNKKGQFQLHKTEY